MFVAIENQEMNIPEVIEWIIKTRDANGGMISPEFAVEILTKTNHFGHIKMVLKNINDKCSDEDKKKYKDFVLACVDKREMSPQALDSLHEMADICGCREEFEELNKEPKLYDKHDYEGVTVKSKYEFLSLEGKNLKVYVVCDDVDLYECDLSKVKEFKFREGADVWLLQAKNFPEVLDFSQCFNVDLGKCDLSLVKELKFREGAKAAFWKAISLPKDLDVSMCSYTDLGLCDLKGLNLKFKEGSKVDLGGAINLPHDLDVSMCSYVSLWNCDLSGVEKIKFRVGVEVNLQEAKNLPKDLDFSQCSEVHLQWCDLSGVEKIKFKDKEQQKKFMEGAKNFNGKVIFDNDKGGADMLPPGYDGAEM